MCDARILDPSVPHRTECLRFCFLGILQSELDQTVALWNNHRIRKVRNSECPHGRPNVLYFTPDIRNGDDCKFSLNPEDISEAKEFVEELPLMGCSKTMVDLLSIIMTEKNLKMPQTVDQANELYISLVSELDILLFT